MTVITEYVTTTISDLVRRANSLRGLESPQLNLPKGEFKELFVGKFLKQFLPSQLDVASGVVVNMAGTQSGQTDIIIYDNRILPPFIQEQHLGLYPVESVIGTIEVKSTLNSGELEKARQAARTLVELFDEEDALCQENSILAPLNRPLCAVLAFDVDGLSELFDQKEGENYLREFPANLFTICVAGQFSWAKVGKKAAWRLGTGHTNASSGEHDYAETARFVALFVDNARTAAEGRHALALNMGFHHDWLSLYIRKH